MNYSVGQPDRVWLHRERRERGGRERERRKTRGQRRRRSREQRPETHVLWEGFDQFTVGHGSDAQLVDDLSLDLVT